MPRFVTGHGSTIHGKRRGFTIHLFQCHQDLAHFFRCVSCDPTERFQFVEAAAKLQPRGIRLIEGFLEGCVAMAKSVHLQSGNQGHPTRIAESFSLAG
jgi:hypothetical protein